MPNNLYLVLLKGFIERKLNLNYIKNYFLENYRYIKTMIKSFGQTKTVFKKN